MYLPNIHMIIIQKSRIQWTSNTASYHDDVIEWKHFPRYWPFVRGIHRSPVNSPHKGQWRGALMFCLTRVWINSWVNNCEAGDLRRYLAHCDVIVMFCLMPTAADKKCIYYKTMAQQYNRENLVCNSSNERTKRDVVSNHRCLECLLNFV